MNLWEFHGIHEFHGLMDSMVSMGSMDFTESMISMSSMEYMKSAITIEYLDSTESIDCTDSSFFGVGASFCSVVGSIRVQIGRFVVCLVCIQWQDWFKL